MQRELHRLSTTPVAHLGTRPGPKKSPTMTKFLLTTAGVAAVLTLLSGGRRQRPFPNDGAYLRALADVHDYCPDDFMRLCTSQGTEMEEELADEGLVAPVRRLATLLIDVRAVDADSDAHGPSRHAAPLRLGRGRDMCLRAHYDELSTECKAAVALVDDAAEAMPHHGFCPFMMSLFFGALIGMVFLCRKIRAKKAVMKKILEAIRADTQLQALVEAKAGVSVPAPCNCKCGLHFRAAVFALVMSMFFTAPLVMVASLVGCCCCKCWKCCRGGCCGPKPDTAPEDYAALSDTEKQQPSSLLAASRN